MYHNTLSSTAAAATTTTTSSMKLDPQCKLFIGGLSYETTDESLAAYFSRFGEIAQSAVMRDADTGRSRGFGFVTFRTQDCAQEALRATHHIVDGRKVESKFAVPRQRPNTPSSLVSHTKRDGSPNAEQQQDASASYPSTPQHYHHRPTISPFPQDLSHSSINSTGSGGEIVNNKIFVGGLKYATNAEVLTRFFEEMFGEVDSAQIILNRDTKKSRGFGFVIFTHPQTVDMVLHRQSTNPLMIEGKQVEVRACTARHTMPPQTPIHMLNHQQQQQHGAPTPLSMITEQELSLNSSSNNYRNSPWTPMMSNRMTFESPPSSSSFPAVFRPQATYTPRPLFPAQQHNSLLHQQYQQQQQQFHDHYNPPNPDLGLFDMSVVGNQLPSPTLSAASSSPLSPHFQRRLSDHQQQQQMHGFASPLPPPSTMGFRPPGQQQQYRSVVPSQQQHHHHHQERSLFGDPMMFPSQQQQQEEHANSLFSTPDPSIFTSPSKPSSGNYRNEANNSSPRNELSRSPVMNGGLSFSSFGTQTIW